MSLIALEFFECPCKSFINPTYIIYNAKYALMTRYKVYQLHIYLTKGSWSEKSKTDG